VEDGEYSPAVTGSHWRCDRNISRKGKKRCFTFGLSLHREMNELRGSIPSGKTDKWERGGNIFAQREDSWLLGENLVFLKGGWSSGHFFLERVRESLQGERGRKSTSVSR